jgi:hypothetical protein
MVAKRSKSQEAIESTDLSKMLEIGKIAQLESFNV